MVDQPALAYIMFIFLDIIVLLIMISFVTKRDAIKQEVIDRKYEDLTQKFIDSTIGYHQNLIAVFKAIPEQQLDLLEKISQLQLRSIGSILDELRIIRDKLEEGNVTREALAKCVIELDQLKAIELDRDKH